MTTKFLTWTVHAAIIIPCSYICIRSSFSSRQGKHWMHFLFHAENAVLFLMFVMQKYAKHTESFAWQELTFSTPREGGCGVLGLPRHRPSNYGGKGTPSALYYSSYQVKVTIRAKWCRAPRFCLTLLLRGLLCLWGLLHLTDFLYTVHTIIIFWIYSWRLRNRDT